MNDHEKALGIFYRRLSKKIEMRKPMQMSAAELDLFVLSGAWEKLTEYAVAKQVAEVRDRLGIFEVNEWDIELEQSQD